MILITRIEYTNMGDVYEARVHRTPVPIFTVGSQEPCDFEIEVETVRGREFVFPNGEQIILGLPEAEARFLGVHAEAWQDLQAQCDHWYERYTNARCRVEQFKLAPFWARLKFLFTKEI